MAEKVERQRQKEQDRFERRTNFNPVEEKRGYKN